MKLKPQNGRCNASTCNPKRRYPPIKAECPEVRNIIFTSKQSISQERAYRHTVFDSELDTIGFNDIVFESVNINATFFSSRNVLNSMNFL